MWRRLAFAVLGGVALSGTILVLGSQTEDRAGAAGQYRAILPGLAADAAPAAATATPSPTPVPGGGSNPALVVTVIIRIVALELSATPSGTTPVLVEADATVEMASAQQSTAAAGTFAIADHPPDLAGCSWLRTFASTGFSVVVYNVRKGAILMGLTSPEWHYTQVCGPVSIRYPAFGEESLHLLLRDVMQPYLNLAANTVELPLNAAAAPGCLQQYGAFSHSGIQADPAQVFVYVHKQGCPLPPLLPLPQPAPTQAPTAYP